MGSCIKEVEWYKCGELYTGSGMVQMWGVVYRKWNGTNAGSCTGSGDGTDVGSCIPEVGTIQMWKVVPEVKIGKMWEVAPGVGMVQMWGVVYRKWNGTNVGSCTGSEHGKNVGSWLYRKWGRRGVPQLAHAGHLQVQEQSRSRVPQSKNTLKGH